MTDIPILPDTGPKKQRRRPVNGNALRERMWRRPANPGYQRVQHVEPEKYVTSRPSANSLLKKDTSSAIAILNDTAFFGNFY